MKRRRDSSDDQEAPHAEKKGRKGTHIPFVQLSENNIGTGSAGFATNIHSSRNNKRNIEEMNGQIELESDRPAKRQDHRHSVTWARNIDDAMQDEAVTHSPRRKKRDIGEMSGQVEPESNRPAKRLDHGHGATWASGVDSLRNNKRSMEEMSGQLDLELDRPTKRLHHDYVMREEAMMHSPRNKKRNIEEMGGQIEPGLDRPPKRMDHGYDTMSAANDDHIMRDESQPIQGMGGEISVYAKRVRVYHQLLQANLGDEKLCNVLNDAYTSDNTTLAEVIHDSPQHVRLWALEMLDTVDTKSRRTIIDAISEIESQKAYNDPVSALPAIMTDSLARKSFGGTQTCVICEGGFCSANEQNPVDVEDVVWKDCGVHLMHLHCFRKEVLGGEMPLKGHCACIENFC
jgi:hypothetical protein